MRPEWYLEEVKTKQNHIWTDEDKLRIFNLREKYSAKDVAEMFGATVIQVYNITRLVRKGIHDECFMCGDPLTPQEKLGNGLIKACFKCKAKSLNYKQNRRKKALNKKLCGYCEKRPVLKGFKACKQCISATYRRRNKNGLCGKCGKRPVRKDNASLCVVCNAENKKIIR